MNILINAYAVSPSWGSEPGMGWNWIVSIAKYCNVFVITEGEWKKEIETALQDLPHKGNIHFYYIPVSERIRRMCWNQGDWRFYYYYRKWQKKALTVAKSIVGHNHIDVIHQLNMVGFREPGYLWKIKNHPYVWGPICGMDSVPIPFVKNLSAKDKLKYIVKNCINYIQSNYSYRIRNTIKSSDAIIAATQGTFLKVRSLSNSTSLHFINETGTCCHNQPQLHCFTAEGCFKILWVGRFIQTKKLDLALDALALLKKIDCQLIIAGTGTNSEIAYYKSYADKLGVQDKIVWLGKVPHEYIRQLMGEANLFLFSSILEATSTVIPEAISCNLPILCFNICGFGPLVKDRVGEAIELSNPGDAARDFAEKIEYLYNHREKLKEYSLACDKYKEELSWNWKAKKMLEIYQIAINNFNRNIH